MSLHDIGRTAVGNGSSKSLRNSAGWRPLNSRFRTNDAASDVETSNITLIAFDKSNDL